MRLPEIRLWRIGVVALAQHACGWTGKLDALQSYGHRSKVEPVYVEVSENEHGCAREKYSSCADLVHWLAKRIGIELAWVNRTDDDFGENWKFAVNVSRIAAVSDVVKGSFLPEPGDCMISWNKADTSDAHVWVYLGPNPDKPGEHFSANYGAAGMSKAATPGAAVRSKPMRIEGSALMYGSRRVQRVLTVQRLVEMRSGSARRPDFSGPPWTAEWTGEVQDALEASFGSSDTEPAPPPESEPYAHER